MNGDKKIGVSIMKIEEKLDSGPILASEEIELDQNATHGEIEKQLSIMGANLLIKSLKITETGNPKFKDQDHSQTTYAKKVDKSEAKIDWSFEANKVLSRIHGLSPIPGAWFEFENERYKVLKAEITSKNGKPGYVLDENLTIACGLNSIKIIEIQRQGKNRQTVKEFLLGKKIEKGAILV